MDGGWQDAVNVLGIRLDNIGDVLMTTPALRALKESHPRRRLTLLTSRSGAAAARLVPEIDAIRTFDAPWMKAVPGTPRGADALRAWLAAERFDAAVIFTVYSQSPLPAAYACWLAGVPRALAHCRENPYQLLSDWVRDPEPQERIRHEVRRQLDLVAAVGCRPRDERLAIAIPPAARRGAETLLAALGLRRGRPLLVAHAGATAASRRYPPASFARALDYAVAETGCDVLLTGTAAESALVDAVLAAMTAPALSLAGRLELAELCAVVETADVVVTNNSSPAHIAAATGTPVVDLYALTNPQHTPWQVEHRLLYHDVSCRYCYKSICPAGHNDCLRKIEPRAVAAAVVDLLERRGDAR